MIPLIDPGDKATFQIDWSDAVAEGVELVSAEHTLPDPLVKEAESINGLSSFVRASGAVHGQLYLVEASAQFSTGETLNRQFPLRCFNG